MLLVSLFTLATAHLLSTPAQAAPASAPFGAPTPEPLPNLTLAAAAAARPGQARRNRIIIAHAVLGAFVFLALVPAALLAGRWLRRFGWWLRVHQLLNGLAVAAVMAAFGTGYYHVGHDHWEGLHQRLGLALLILILLQALGGLAAHHSANSARAYPRPTLSRAKSPLRLLHIATGLALAALGIAQVHTGIALWRKAIHFYVLPAYLYTMLWAVAGTEVALYVAGWAYEAAEVRRAGRERRSGGGGQVGMSREDLIMEEQGRPRSSELYMMYGVGPVVSYRN